MSVQVFCELGDGFVDDVVLTVSGALSSVGVFADMLAALAQEIVDHVLDGDAIHLFVGVP